MDKLGRYQVIVGNVGTVYDGNDWEVAKKEYNEYCEMSKSNYGKVAGEPVTLMADGEAWAQHRGETTIIEED